MQQPGNQDGPQRMDRTGSEEYREADFASAEDGDSESVEQELAAARDKLVRLQADMENYRKRVDRTINEIVRSRRADVLRAMLPVIDNLDRAIESVDPETADAAGVIEGVRLTRKQMADVLKGQGVEPIEAGGDFNPNYHEVVATVADPDRSDGEIVDVVRAGYLLQDLVLRPSMVRVTKNPTDNEVGAD